MTQSPKVAPIETDRLAFAAKRLFRGALSNSFHPQPRVINTDPAPIYGAAIADIKEEGILRRRCGTDPCSTLTISSNKPIEGSNAG